jgi:hypothetical protein
MRGIGVLCSLGLGVAVSETCQRGVDERPVRDSVRAAFLGCQKL